MKLFNNTPVEAIWGITLGDAHDCGHLAANKTKDIPRLDNQKNVKVAFNAAGAPPGEPPAPFSVTIPQTGTGLEVIIGLYQQ